MNGESNLQRFHGRFTIHDSRFTMTQFVIGTAGHIDHGKSALVKALTGIDPDRLKEEQRRGMTIDLGFAHLDLPGGRRAGIVDVPGHERLIKNMLAGATGIDLVLFVIAADEGVMPQTREHLDILRFLPVHHGIIVINKIDLITDPAWLALVTDDVRTLTAGSFLEDAPLLQVSARTGAGLPELIGTIDRLLDDVTPRAIDAPARLPIDRVFTMSGFGTVITGTLWSGKIRRDGELELLPQGRRVRVRGVQSHGVDLPEGTAGSRVAVNLVGIEKSEIDRGNVLATVGAFLPTALVDVRLRLLPSAPPLAHLARVRISTGSDEILGRVALLDRSRLQPGDATVGQIRLERPAVVAAGDPFVVRSYSPVATVGGGTVLAPHPPRRRRGEDSVEAIEHAAEAAPDSRIEDLIAAGGTDGMTLDEVARRAGQLHAETAAAIDRLTGTGAVVSVRDRVFHRGVADALAGEILVAVDAYHRMQPWRSGIPRDDLKGRVFRSGDDRFYAAVLDDLIQRNELGLDGGLLRRPAHRPQWTASESVAREAVAGALAAGGASPPGPEVLQRVAGDPKVYSRILQMLLDDGTVIEAAPDVYFHREAVARIREAVAGYVAANGSITVAALRDLLKTSRRYALTVLEYFDTIKFTRRIGDKRILLKSGESVNRES